MQEVRIYHQDELYYFNQFRISDLILVKQEGYEIKYLLILDMQSYDFFYSEDEITNLEERFKTKVNNEENRIWVTLKQFCELESIDEIDELIIEAKDCEGKLLFFGGQIDYILLFNNIIKFSKNNSTVHVNWAASSEDPQFAYEDARPYKVEMNFNLNLTVFNEQEYLKTEKQKNEVRDIYFGILRKFNGQGFPDENFDYLNAISFDNISELEKSKLAWKIANDRALQ
jgi:hypothetical protein